MPDMESAVQIAYATMKARKLTISKATEAVSKSLKLSAEDASILERCLIELRLGIGDDEKEWSRKPSEWLSLYKEAVLSKEYCTLGGLDSCSAKEAEAVLSDFIARRMY